MCLRCIVIDFAAVQKISFVTLWCEHCAEDVLEILIRKKKNLKAHLISSHL